MNLYNIPHHEESPEIVNGVVEISKGNSAKYEYDPSLNLFRLDRCLSSAMVYPVNYGFIPSTKAADGDPLDIMIYNNIPLDRGTLVQCYVVGVLEMTDGGDNDYKILTVPCTHIRRIKRISDVDPMFLNITKNFFKHYKDLEGKKVTVGDWLSREKALDIIREDMLYDTPTLPVPRQYE